ncbi:hypothetical protein J8273_6125 [Carpediemonas membranifera]|uniref:Uncharacterized protein n=1 Tax=Carpediemonas membranifera TaxID=201153 RepID=A0A8J6BVG0_9EUKA|nr:hypothetical protein J8273_6125 [Carpediemonas membranifera]|eukprot:KAG9391371.1 hypothetical protein J8273_6125 [Carpediemonas membranifera]
MHLPETKLNNAPFLRKATTKSWYTFRQDYEQYAAREADPIVAFDLIETQVLEVLKIRIPELEGFLEYANETPDEEPADTSELNEAFITMVDELMQPLDEVDALDRFKDLSCGSEGNLIYNMAAYALAYKRQVRNCCKVRPTEKLIVDAFVAGIRYGRLKERVNAKKAKTLDETIAEAFIQATEAEKARREHQRVERESATSATMTKAKEKSETACEYCQRKGCRLKSFTVNRSGVKVVKTGRSSL